MHRTRTASLLLASLGLLCLGLVLPLHAASQVTLGATINTHSPNGISGVLYMPAGVTVNDTVTNVEAVVTRGTTSAGAIITLQPTNPATGQTAFSGTFVGLSGLPDQGPLGATVNLFLP